MVDLNKYQKEAQLKDGTKVLLRPMVAEDNEALYEFFKAVPREEARYLRDDVKRDYLLKNGQTTLITTRPCQFWR